MSYELKENTGIILKNDRKKESKHPDYNGMINVNGQTLDIALWVKEGKKGKFFSASISEPRQQSATNDSQPQYSNKPPQQQSRDSDMPF